MVVHGLTAPVFMFRLITGRSPGDTSENRTVPLPIENLTQFAWAVGDEVAVLEELTSSTNVQLA